MPLSLPIEPEATKLLHDSPLALLLGMLLDQQIPDGEGVLVSVRPEAAARPRPGRARDRRRSIPEAFEAIFAKPPALHRFPRAIAKRTQELCQMLVERYDGDAAKLWTEAKDGRDAVARIGQLPGFGKQKSQIFVALLAKQFGIQPEGWREATGVYGEEGSLRSVADITDETLAGQGARVQEGHEGRRQGRRLTVVASAVVHNARCSRIASSSWRCVAGRSVPSRRPSRATSTDRTCSAWAFDSGRGRPRRRRAGPGTGRRGLCWM